MLLDFSDLLQVNVYSLGKTYLQLSRELCINIPAIDPCLYIPRFAHKLEFEDKTHDVSMTALRLVSRMKRDWMHTGRRPSGLCGAALLVAARIHDFNRSVKDLIKVVKVCDTTIRKRLAEFQATPSGQLTIEEFHNIDLEEEHDPPSFTEGKRKAKLAAQFEEDSADFTTEVSKLQEEIEKSLEPPKPRGIWAAYSKMDNTEKSYTEDTGKTNSEEVERVSEFLETETLKECLPENSVDVKTVDNVNKLETEIKNGPHTTTNLGIKEAVEECLEDNDKDNDNDNDDNSEDKAKDGELDLSGIDDAEIDKMLLNEDEIKIKTDIWMAENADYLIAQKEKEERLAKEKELEAQNPEKKKKKKRKKQQPIQAATAEEAIVKLLQEKKISNKINYDVLNDLKCKTKFEKPATPIKDETDSKPSISRFRKTSLSLDLKEGDKEAPASKVRKIEETEKIVIESGPVQYAANTKEELDADEDEAEYEDEEEDGLVSAAQLLGHNQDYDPHDVYDDDEDID